MPKFRVRVKWFLQVEETGHFEIEAADMNAAVAEAHRMNDADELPEDVETTAKVTDSTAQVVVLEPVA